ncbi:MAG: HAD-IIIC family phosphatase [Lachnospiraceae bacterium]|nr:HAD-IIIC family phosphatase [Lachnospiraceae bacterium]
MRELEYPFSEDILKKKKRLRRMLLECEGVNYDDKNIAILGGSTTDDIRAVLELFLLNYGIRPKFYESEYNQYYEDAMFPNAELEAFAPDVIIFFTSNRNIPVYPTVADSAESVEEKLQAVYGRFAQMWDHVAETYHCTVIQNNFELPFYRLLGNKDASDIHGRVNFISRLNQMFYEYAQRHENFYIHDIHYESASYGLEKWSDPFYWHMYKYALCVPAIPYTAFGLANIIKSCYGKNKKALVLDMDNTLWGGVIGDDGADHIEIGQETSLGQTYSEFQAYLKAQKDLGVLLAVASKNEHETAMTGLKRPDSVLREEDFASIRANWNPKDVNILEIAQELTLLPESFVFVDDNPAEREIVRKQIPGIAVPEMEEVEHYIQTIDRNGYFEVTNLSADDVKRNDMYQANAMRMKAQAAFADYTEYLKSLEMKGTIRRFEPMYLSRIAQLTNKSNQFNLTTKRYSLAEIEEAAEDPDRITLYGKLEDKFGDNGVVSVVIGRVEGDTLHIELWLMSCRVLKRDMEYAMMDELAAQCEKRGIRTILGYYYPTAKNAMVKDFYGKQGFEKAEEDEEGNALWRFALTPAYQKKNTVINVEEA